MPIAYSVPTSVLEGVSTAPSIRNDNLRLETPTVQEEMRREMEKAPFAGAVGFAATRKMDQMRNAASGYWADMVGDRRMKQAALNREHRGEMHDQAMEATRPGAKVLGGALGEMTVPAPYLGSKLVPSILSGMGQTFLIEALTPERRRNRYGEIEKKTMEDMLSSAGATGLLQAAAGGAAKLAMPGKGPTARSKLTPESKARMMELEGEGFNFLRGTREGLPRTTVEDRMRDLSTTAAGRRGFEGMEAHNQAVADRIATRSIGSTADRPTEAVMLEAKERMGDKFSELFSDREFQADNALWDALDEVVEGSGPGRLSRLVKRHPDIRSMAERIQEEIAEDMAFGGNDVQSFLKKINTKAKTAWNKGERDYAEGMDELGDVLLEWAGRSKQDPDFHDQLKKVRSEYANWNTLAGKMDTEGSVDTRKIAKELGKKGEKQYAQGKRFSALDPLYQYDRYAARVPASSGIMQRGKLGNIVGSMAPYTKPRYWGNRAIHAGLLQDASPNLPGILSNITGYAASRPDVSALLGGAALGGAGGMGVAADLLFPGGFLSPEQGL